MDITLYKCRAENNCLDKRGFLDSALLINNAQVKGTFDVVAPQLLLQYRGDLSGYNYAKIIVDGTTYYYYATVSGEIGSAMRVSCRRDPATSFLSQLLQTPIEVTRCTKQAIEGSESGYNSMIHDTEIVTSCQRTYREFPFTLDGTSNRMSLTYPGTEYILAVIG